MISNNHILSSEKLNTIVTRKNKLKKFILKTNQIKAHRQVKRLNDSRANLFNFIKDSTI